jgi:hypothetical protein
MKRIHIPGIVDIVSSDDPAEIVSFAQDPRLDRAYADHSILVNGSILRRVQETLQIDGKPFPTVSPKCAQGRAEAQEALWIRLSAIAAHYATGPDELENLAAFVCGEGSQDACGRLVQQVVGGLFVPNFTATEASWNAAVLLDKAPRTVNPVLLVWWALTHQVEKAKRILADMVGGDPAAMHAIGIALHNIVSGVELMRQLYGDPANRTGLSPETAAGRCIFAPAKVLRQPTGPENTAKGQLATGTLVILNLEDAKAKAAGRDVAFLRGTWSQCPAEAWVPALLEGIWRRACAHRLNSNRR